MVIFGRHDKDPTKVVILGPASSRERGRGGGGGYGGRGQEARDANGGGAGRHRMQRRARGGPKISEKCLWHNEWRDMGVSSNCIRSIAVTSGDF